MVVEDDLYLGARERRGEIEKEREEREREGVTNSHELLLL
jgi:hypothetical protein